VNLKQPIPLIVLMMFAGLALAQDSTKPREQTADDLLLDQMKHPQAKRAALAYQQAIERATQQYIKTAEGARKVLINSLEGAAKTAAQSNDKEEARVIGDTVTRLKAGALPVVPGGAGPIGAVPFGNKWYRLVLGNYTWTDAKAEAEAMGGRLVCISGSQEAGFLTKLTGKSVRVWVGATDEHKEGDWRWIDGTPVDKSLWAGGEPNNGMGGENYAELRHSGRLNDTFRNDRVDGFVVEFPRNPGP
jgi:hypothetical protein